MGNYNIMVTGANGETASAVITSFLNNGYTVIGLSSSSEHNHIKCNQYTHIQTDILDIDKLKISFNTIFEQNIQIHGLINIAGGFTMGQNIDGEISKEWERMYQVNFVSALNCISLVIRHMKDYNFGRIINFGSSVALEGMASAGPYIISKACVHALTKTLAKELDDYDITCNAILPGIIDTLANRTAMPNEDTNDWVSMNTIFNSINTILKSNDNGFLITI